MTQSVKNSWITSNILDRLTDKNCDFKVSLNPRSFQKLDFYTATKQAALEIANKYDKIYIGLSGGIDSEYVFNLFHELKIPCTPIIVSFPGTHPFIGNKLEAEFAFYKCKQLNIEPIVLTCNEIEYLSIFNHFAIQRLGGTCIYNAPSFILADYVRKNDGVLITSDHMLTENVSIRGTASLASIWEGDFYLDSTNVRYLVFYDYTPEVFYSMVKEFDGSDLQQFKSRLYSIPFRPKIRPIFSKDFYNRFTEHTRHLAKEIQRTHVLGTKWDVLKKMDRWNCWNTEGD